jgi:hypothetical protein
MSDLTFIVIVAYLLLFKNKILQPEKVGGFFFRM